MTFELINKVDFKTTNRTSWEVNSKFILESSFNQKNISNFLKTKICQIKQDKQEIVKLLDVGCGNGWLKDIIPNDLVYQGIDNCTNFVSSLNNTKGNHFLELDIEVNQHNQKLEALKSNIVVCCLSLIEMSYLDIVFKNLYELTSKNGYLIIVSLNPLIELYRVSENQKDYKNLISNYKKAKNHLVISKKINIGEKKSTLDYYRILYSFEDYFDQASNVGFTLEEFKEDINEVREPKSPMYEYIMFKKE
ncbi:hypothetical protein [Flavobacterium sp.]|jgi:2-polyprenyl-3-methyl-5-hydroxy-6-metoxy-1,4-benzoquinol methylase|uniref:hypothetical protein n=1 Tax=Flavobacterium sp. TaxID=239 RepID=UPI0037BFBD4B